MTLLFTVARISAVVIVTNVLLARTALAMEANALSSQTNTASPIVVCGLPVPVPVKEPPAGSPPIVLALLLCFDKQGGTSLVEPQTYLYYIHARPSEPSRDVWVGYDDGVERGLVEDFRRLWGTNFLDDLAIEVRDHPFANGVIGKLIIFHLEERERVKIVDYVGAVSVSRTDIADRLKAKGIELRLDAFLDHGTLRRVASAVRELYSEKGFQFAEVTWSVTGLAGGPKLARVIFNIKEGPKVAIRDVEFVGNKAFSDRQLERALKTNKAQNLLSLIGNRGVYSEDKFAEDAQRLTDFYRDRGYITARIGTPTLKPLDDSADGRTRWVQLRIPVFEGAPFTLGRLAVEGNTVIKTEALLPLFQMASGDPYREEAFRKGFEKARELYGAGGYFEFTAYPDLHPRDGERVVDVTLRVTEGKQYFVNRITFSGNTQTHDEVIRREVALVEGGVFNTEALKYSIRRLNQLGYFKPLDERGVNVEKAAGAEDRVDIELKVEEQNRNQFTFGMGASQYEGIFANVSFSTSNFLGRGETVTLVLQKGSRSNTYQLGLTEPFIFGKPISVGGTVYSRKLDYALRAPTVDYSEVRDGVNFTAGFPIRRFTRLFATYAYEIVNTAMSDDLQNSLKAGSSPASLVMDEGRFVESSITGSLVHNTVDNPFAPRRGKRLSISYQYAGGVLRGTSNFVKPETEAIWYVPVTRRTAIGLRANAGQIVNYGRDPLPYYQRYFLGGETQIRGVDIRTVGPHNENRVALGGTTFVLFNAEYYYDILPQVRALAFHDAGQAFGEKETIDLRQLRTSSGLELRVTLPVVNVPFRLIYAWNVYRDTFQPARTFKFAVGTTF